MASREVEAVIRCAAMRAEGVLGQVVGAISLLVEEMDDLKHLPDADRLSSWCVVIYWLSGCLEGEISNLADSLRHDEMVAREPPA